MPVYKLNRSIRPEALALRAELEGEWRRPSKDAGAPEIFVTDAPPEVPVEIYVVWGKWSHVASNDRSEIILDVFQSIFGREAILRVVIARGLTPAEARLMGISAEHVQ